MSAFLFLLVKVNLAMGMAIVLVALLRRPLRAQFGAPIAYAIWFLVPIAGMASLLPPRVVAAAPITVMHVPAAPVSVAGPVAGSVAHSALRLAGGLTGQGAVIAVTPPAPVTALPDTALLLVAAWALGTVLMAFYLARLQLRFFADVRRGKGGPAVLGFWRPRIVTPDGFEARFTAREQAAILAHERVHLARQDARINALAALLRCLCWFNPLIHLGAGWLRIDQELACDASVVATSVSRRDYAKALFKSQLVVASLPLGCNWPGSQHPLIERIALLKRKPPGKLRRLAGACLILVAASFAGLGAWAAQPPVVKSAPPRMVPAALPVMAAAPVQAAAQSATDAGPVSNSNDVGAVKTTSAIPIPVRVQAARTIGADTTAEPIPVALPQITSEPNTDQTSQNATPVPKETAAATSAPHPKTEPAIGCLLGFGRWNCPANTATGWKWCGEGYEQRFVYDCPDGPLETVDYLGTNAAGADVYEAQYRHQDTTILAGPAGIDQKADVHFIRANPNAVIPSSLVDVSSSAVSGMRLYRRPQDSAQSSAKGDIAVAAAASPPAAAPEPLVLPNTPSGEGDPDTIVCRAPQRLPGTDTFGEEACGHNYEWQKLAWNGKDLAADDRTLIDRPTVANPTGEGDPDIVTCRTPKFRISGPLVEVCRSNRFWANLIKNRQTVGADGTVTQWPMFYAVGGGMKSGPGPGDADSGHQQSGGMMPLPAGHFY